MPDISSIGSQPATQPTDTGDVGQTAGVHSSDKVSDTNSESQFVNLAKSMGVTVVDGQLDLSSLLNSVEGMKKLEFLLEMAMIIIAKSKMDEFVENMKDSVKEARLDVKEADEQAADIKEEGTDAMAGAIAGGVMTIAASTVSIVGAGAAMKAGGGGAGGKFKLGAYQSSQMRWNSVSQVTNSCGTMVDGGMKYCAADAQGKAAEDQAESSKSATDASNMKDAASADQKFIEQLLQILMAIIDTDHSSKTKISS